MNASSNRGGVGATFTSGRRPRPLWFCLGVRREDDADRVALDDPVDYPVLVERLGEDRPPTALHPRELKDPSVDATGQFEGAPVNSSLP